MRLRLPFELFLKLLKKDFELIGVELFYIQFVVGSLFHPTLIFDAYTLFNEWLAHLFVSQKYSLKRKSNKKFIKKKRFSFCKNFLWELADAVTRQNW